jgi:hypothetical protein
MSQVQEIFGQYAVELNGEVKLYLDRQEAETALALAKNQEEFTSRADLYCIANGLEGKNAKAKINVIVDFLAYEASARANTAQPEQDTLEQKYVHAV